LTDVLVNIQERLKLALTWNCRIDFVKKYLCQNMSRIWYVL